MVAWVKYLWRCSLNFGKPLTIANEKMSVLAKASARVMIDCAVSRFTNSFHVSNANHRLMQHRDLG